MPDTTTDEDYRWRAGDSDAAQQLANLFGPDYAAPLISAGGRRFDAAFPPDRLHGCDGRDVAAVVLLAALSDFTRGEIRGGLLDGAQAAVRDAELGAVADTLRAALRAAKDNPANPIEGLIGLADAVGVDLDGDDPANPHRTGDEEVVVALTEVIAAIRLRGINNASGYTLARAILDTGYGIVDAGPGEDVVLTHEEPGRTAYRMAVPGLVVAGVADIKVQGDWWHAEETIDGQTYTVDAEDELAAILALVAKRQGLAAVFGPDGDRPELPLDERHDPAYGLVLTAVTQAVTRTRFLSLSDRGAIASQVYQDLRAAGVIA